MKRVGFAWFVFAMAVSPCLTAQDLAGEDRLAVLRSQFEELKADLDSAEIKFNALYSDQLAALEKSATEKGNLPLVIDVRGEAKAFRGRTGDPVLSKHPELARMQKIYAERIASIRSEKQATLLTLMKGHHTRLIELRTDLTKGGKIEPAMKVHEEIARLEEAAKQVRDGQALARVIPKGADHPQSPTVPEPPGGSEPPIGVAATGSTPALVANSVRAKGSVEGAAANVIAFDGPTGDGRRGAKGILVKSAGGGDSGSTWVFKYTRGGTARGLQIIHPRGKGQAVVYINKDSIGVSTPGEWRSVGYGGGNTKDVRKKNAFENVFPLEDNREYAVVSRMDNRGSCDVFIDGELIATARAGTAKPLSFEIPEGTKFPGSSGWDKLLFKGEGFPLEWEGDWAGILLGPLDGGTHVCADVHYCAGVAEMP